METIKIGQEVTAVNTFPKQWWGKESNYKYGKTIPLVITGKVTKIFKNGKLLVPINEMPNNSGDGLTSMNIEQKDLIINWPTAE